MVQHNPSVQDLGRLPVGGACPHIAGEMVMKYVVTFEYMDGKEVSWDVPPNDIERFMEDIGKDMVYYNPDRGIGMWVPIDKIRFFRVEHVDEQGNRISQDMRDLLPGHESNLGRS